MLGASLVGVITGLTIDRCWLRGFQPKFAIGLSLLIGLLGVGLGLSQGLALCTVLGSRLAWSLTWWALARCWPTCRSSAPVPLPPIGVTPSGRLIRPVI